MSVAKTRPSVCSSQLWHCSRRCCRILSHKHPTALQSFERAPGCHGKIRLSLRTKLRYVDLVLKALSLRASPLAAVRRSLPHQGRGRFADSLFGNRSAWPKIYWGRKSGDCDRRAETKPIKSVPSSGGPARRRGSHWAEQSDTVRAYRTQLVWRSLSFRDSGRGRCPPKP